MRYGINVLYLLPGMVGGTETYAAGLIRGLAEVAPEDHFTVFVNREARDWPLPASHNVERVVCPVNATSRLARYWYEQTAFPRTARERNLDLLHSLGYVAPLRAGLPSVVTILDLNFRAFRNTMPLTRRLGLEFFVGRAARSADHLLTISEFGRRELLREYGLAPERVTAILLAADRRDSQAPAASVAPASIAPGYIVAFSSPFPHKNIPRLIQAVELARERHHIGQRLLVLGHRSPGLEIERPWLEFTGYVSQAERDQFLSGADLLAFPSLYEGFGLPVLEAMARGVPVVTSDRASLPEVAGAAAVYFDPMSTEDMAAKLAAVAGDPAERERLRKLGLENAARFSWSRTALETLAVYRAVLARQALT